MFKHTRVAAIAATILSAVALGGCVYAPPPGYAYAAPGYYGAPAYYAPYGYGGYYGGGVALSFGDRGYRHHW